MQNIVKSDQKARIVFMVPKDNSLKFQPTQENVPEG